jgi:hypothetical protein
MSEIHPGLAKLREPFPAHQISRLPKESRAQIDERKANRDSAINCQICGSWHHKRAVHLDYVGHAALTDRLLDADPSWSWEPLTMSPEGLPTFDGFGGMWIRLTVCGVTRLGYGHAGDKNGGDAIKEVIGDALRNAAMRFGAALELWHKGDLHKDDDTKEPAEPAGRGVAASGGQAEAGNEPVDAPRNFGLTPARYKVVRAVANAALQAFNESREIDAYGEVSAITDNDEKLALWSILKPHSALRTAMKRLHDEEEAAQAKLNAERKAA